MGPCLSKQPVNHGEAYEFSGASEPKDKKDKKDKPEVRANPDSPGGSNGRDSPSNATKTKRAPAQRVMSVSKDRDHEQVPQLRAQGMTERLHVRPAGGESAKPETHPPSPKPPRAARRTTTRSTSSNPPSRTRWSSTSSQRPCATPWPGR